mgnify:CR=1 FL=1
MIDVRLLAFETGGTKLVVALTDAEANLIETRVLRRAEADRAETSLARLLDAGRALLAGARPTAVGFGYGGAVDRERRRPLVCLHEPGWEALDIVAAVEAEFGAPVALENDCKAAALAEARLGAGRGAESVFYATIGTGIGGGFVRDGRIAAFGPRGECEVGHVVVEPGGPECDCGNRGCLEALCAGPRFPRLYRGGADGLAAREIFERAAAGDAEAERALDRAADYLGRAFGSIANLLCPQRIVAGGGLGSAYPAFLEQVERRMEAYTVPYFRGRARVVPGTLGESVVTRGAALLARELASKPVAQGVSPGS